MINVKIIRPAIRGKRKLGAEGSTCPLTFHTLPPSKHEMLTNVGLMLVHRLRRWASINPTLVNISCLLGIWYLVCLFAMAKV